MTIRYDLRGLVHGDPLAPIYPVEAYVSPCGAVLAAYDGQAADDVYTNVRLLAKALETEPDAIIGQPSHPFPSSPLARAIIDAIDDGIGKGGDVEDWDAPEFAQARDLTGHAGLSWEFTNWTDTLAMVDCDDPSLGGSRL